MAKKDEKSTLAPLEIVTENAIEDEKILEIAFFLINNHLLNIADILLQGSCVAKAGICDSCEKFVVNVINKQNKMN